MGRDDNVEKGFLLPQNKTPYGNNYIHIYENKNKKTQAKQKMNILILKNSLTTKHRNMSSMRDALLSKYISR